VRLPLALGLAAALALPACGAGQESAPAGSTERLKPEADLPDVAQVVCEEGGTRAGTPSVKPQEDGIHLEIVNETAEDLGLEIGEKQGEPVMGMNADRGTSTEILELPPGSIWLACRDRQAVVSWVEIEVVDQDGVWLEGTGAPMPCTVVASGFSDYVPGAQGHATPSEAVRRHYEERIRPDDVLEQLGYPDEARPNFALLRDGVTVAGFEVANYGDGWLVESDSSCGA
jgi:hypothetical protein